MSKKHGDSEKFTDIRRKILEDLYEKYYKQQRQPTDKELLEDLKRAGFHISIRTLTRDKVELASNNTFVEDIAKKTYSKMLNDCYDSLIYVEQQAWKALEKDWKRNRKFTKTYKNGDITTTEITEELAEPKLRALEVIKECAMAKANLVNGKTLRMSAGMWSKHVEKLEADNDKLRQEKLALEEKLAFSG